MTHPKMKAFLGMTSSAEAAANARQSRPNKTKGLQEVENEADKQPRKGRAKKREAEPEKAEAGDGPDTEEQAQEAEEGQPE